MRGGAERSILEITIGLVKQRHDVVVYSKSTTSHKRGKNMHVNAITPPLIDGIGKYLWPVNDMIHFFLLFKMIQKERPDVILTQQSISFISVLIATLLRIPCFQMIRDVSYFCPTFYGLIPKGVGLVPCDISKRSFHHCFYCVMRRDLIQYRIGIASHHSLFNKVVNLGFCVNIIRTRLYDALLKYTTKVFVSSKMLLDFTRAHASKSIIVPMTPISFDKRMNPENIKGPDFMNKKYNMSSDTLKLLIISSINGNYTKGVDFIIENVLPRLKRSVVLFIAGSKELQGTSSPRVIDLGRLDTTAISEMLSYVDLLLVPSVWIESFGRVVIEGIFHNKPVFASNRVGALDDESYPFIKRLKLSATTWINEIEQFQPAHLIINDKEREHILQKYSTQNCVNIIEKKIKR
nr:glycosyltransferase [Candidatus Sigynarchaeum springense]